MRFKEWFLKEMTSTANIAAFKRMSIPLVRRAWPSSIATMFDQNPPGKKKKKKVYKQPQVEEGVAETAGDLEGAILQLLQQSPEGLQIGEMVKSLGLDPNITGQEEDGWTFSHGHHQSPFNQALIVMVQQGLVKANSPQWGAPTFTIEGLE